ncbi:MAG: UDP-2,3-diacylglucosamine diphosphatase LpxI [Alphaproteobacteria bacterium]|nr:UDP-2,3-diacylglucosamine diphosphatase LpxI [Alphaproteobacteria bacterium]
MSAAPKLGILAGGGTAPLSLVQACRDLNRDFFVIGLEGQANADFSGTPHDWVSLGEGAKLKGLIADNQIQEIVMIGRVRRPSLTELRPDFVAIKMLMKVGLNSAGDDELLTSIGKAIEDECGVRVIGAHEVFAGLLTPEGQLGHVTPDEEAQKDITRGIEIAKSLGKLDVGQSVIVQQGIVLGVEAIEGTDALIVRSAGLRREGPGGILIKIAKPQQDNRYDLPTVGPDTIAAMAKAGLRGVALEAGRSLLIEREKTTRLADEANIFIIARKIS